MPDYSTLPSDVNDDDFFDQRAQAYGDTLGRYLDQTVSPYNPMSPLPSYQDAQYVNPMDLPLESDQVPMYLQGPVMPSQSEPLGADVPPPQDFNGMDWSSDPSTGGLGLAMSPPSMGSPGMSPDWATGLKGVGAALEGFSAGYFGRTPLYLQQKRVDQQQKQIDMMNAYRRDQMAQQLKAQEETRRQNQWEDIKKILGNKDLTPPQQTTMLKELGKTNPHAAQAAQSVNEKMISEFRTYGQFMPRKPEEYLAGLKEGSLRWDDIAADLEVAKEGQKSVAKESAQQRKLQGLLDRFREDPSSLSDTEIDQIDAYTKAKEERTLKVQELQQKLNRDRQTLPLDVQHKQQEVERGKAPIVSQPFYNQTGETRNIITDPRTGQQREVGGVPFSKSQQQIMPAGMQKDRADTLSSMATLKDVAGMFHPDFVGKADTAWNAIGRALGLETSRSLKDPKSGETKTVKETEFRTSYDALIKLLRKETMGTAQSVQELSANPLAYPSATDIDADKTIPSFMKNQFQSLVRKLEAQNQVVSEQRRSGPMAASVRMKQLMEMAQAKDQAGKNALGFKSADEMNRAIAERLAEEVQNGWVIPDISGPQR
jgi:hypothetical protein